MLYRETRYRRLKRAGTLANGLELLVSSVDQLLFRKSNLVEAQKRNLQPMNCKRATPFGIKPARVTNSLLTLGHGGANLGYIS
jgi:hypothetical protein